MTNQNEHICNETKLDKVLDWSSKKQNKAQATYALKTLCHCLFIISLGVSVGCGIGTGFFIYDHFMAKAERLK